MGLPRCLDTGSEAGHDDGREPETGVVTAVRRLNVLASLVPVAFRRRLAHVSLDTLGGGQIVHVSSKETSLDQ